MESIEKTYNIKDAVTDHDYTTTTSTSTQNPASEQVISAPISDETVTKISIEIRSKSSVKSLPDNEFDDVVTKKEKSSAKPSVTPTSSKRKSSNPKHISLEEKSPAKRHWQFKISPVKSKVVKRSESRNKPALPVAIIADESPKRKRKPNPRYMDGIETSAPTPNFKVKEIKQPNTRAAEQRRNSQKSLKHKPKVINTSKKRGKKSSPPEISSPKKVAKQEQIESSHEITVMAEDGIIRIIEKNDGEVETYLLKDERSSSGNTEVYECRICHLDFALKENLEYHMNKHDDDISQDAIAVKEVEKVVEDEGPLMNRDELMARIEEDDVEVVYQCNICYQSFKDFKKLEKHIQHKCVGKSKDVGGLSCPTCCRLFQFKSLLKLHMYTHTGEKPYKCEYCNMKFAQPGNLNKHLYSVHDITKNERITCQDCSQRFSNVKLFTNHTVHVDKPHVCIKCQDEFLTRCEYYQHWSKVHEVLESERSTFVCSHCGKSFNYMVQLTVHERIHTGVKPFECPICQKGFTQKGNMNVHMKSHSLRPDDSSFKCFDCNRLFSSRKQLEVHERVHSGEKPFVCEVCGKAFSQQGNLNVHKKIHTGKKDFHCETCGKSFAHGPQLRVHMRIHTGSRPYACNMCDKGFTQAGNLTVHMKNVHGSRNKKRGLGKSRYIGRGKYSAVTWKSNEYVYNEQNEQSADDSDSDLNETDSDEENDSDEQIESEGENNDVNDSNTCKEIVSLPPVVKLTDNNDVYQQIIQPEIETQPQYEYKMVGQIMMDQDGNQIIVDEGNYYLPNMVYEVVVSSGN